MQTLLTDIHEFGNTIVLDFMDLSSMTIKDNVLYNSNGKPLADIYYKKQLNYGTASYHEVLYRDINSDCLKRFSIMPDQNETLVEVVEKFINSLTDLNIKDLINYNGDPIMVSYEKPTV